MSDTTETPRQLVLADGDVARPDEDICKQELDGCTTRTAQKYDKQGCPYLIIKGKKWRPVRGVREWLSKRIVSKQPERTTRRAVERRRGRMQSSA
jgi:hypothetical protein